MHHLGTDPATGWVCLTCYPVAAPPTLTVTNLRAGVYLVDGGAEPHVVTLAADGTATCDCADRYFRERECKHITAVRQMRAGA